MKNCRFLLLSALAVPALFSLSCQSGNDTSIVVHVVADATLGLDAVDMIARSLAGGASAGAGADAKTEHFADPSRVTWVLFAGGGDKMFPIEVEARGMKTGAGAPVVSQRAVLSFKKGQRIEVTLTLDRDCQPVACAATLTCQRGVCVDPGTVGNPGTGGDASVTADVPVDRGGADRPAADDGPALADRGDSAADGARPDVAASDVGGDVAGDRPDGAAADVPMPKGLGTVCTTNTECASTHCADGVCCNDVCGGSCQQCDTTATPGYCVAIAANLPAPSKRAPCATDLVATCKQTGLCDGKGACQLYADGQVCKAATCDVTANAITDSRCDGMGTCKVGVPLTCAPFRCKAGTAVCARTCAVAADCDGQPCLASSCGKLKVGATCASDVECELGFCVDTVCCNSRCAGLCQSCNLSGTVGTCSNLRTGQPVGGRAACTGTGTCGGSCTGQADCSYPATTVSCRAAGCDVATLTLPANCNAAGACPAVATMACPGHLRCQTGATVCLAQCTTTANCVAGFYCAGTTCTATKANGMPCTLGAECVSNQCFDGVCCNAACGGTCQTCSTGTCLAVTNADDSTCTGTMTCNAAGACVTKPSLSVAAAAGSSADFGAVVLNTPKIQSFTVTNSGGQASTGLTILVAGTDFAQVTGLATDCAAGAPVAGGGNCTVRVRLTPTASLKRAGSLSVSATAGGSPPPITLTGRVITEFTVPQPVYGITSGADGNLWMTGGTSVGVVMRMTLAGAISTFTVNFNDEITGVALPGRIVSGRLDSNVWFTESALIIRMATAGAAAGTFMAFQAEANQTMGVTTTADGHIWVANDNGGAVQLLQTGVPVPPTVNVSLNPIFGIATGPDGFVWAALAFDNQVAKFADGSAVTRFTAAGPTLIASGGGTDQALYFIETSGFSMLTPNNRIGRITTAGAITEITVPTAGAGVRGIVAGGDGAVWFTEGLTNKLGRFTPPAGPVVEFATPASPGAIAVGPDGNIWFSEAGLKVANITP